jgi:hypothetical protein
MGRKGQIQKPAHHEQLFHLRATLTRWLTRYAHVGHPTRRWLYAAGQIEIHGSNRPTGKSGPKGSAAFRLNHRPSASGNHVWYWPWQHAIVLTDQYFK